LEEIEMAYKSDLTDAEWEIIKPIFTRATKGQHFCKHTKRELIDGVRYINKTGCQWEFLPNEYPPYKTVNSFYVRAKKAGLWEEMNALLVTLVRIKEGRNPDPTYGLIDSQSVKTVYDSEERGIDGVKKRKDENDILLPTF
jgi:putative transposase